MKDIRILDMPREALDAVLRGTALGASVLALTVLVGCGGDGDDASDSTVAGDGSAATAGGQSGGGGQSPADFGEEAGAADRAAEGGAVEGFLLAFADGEWSTACSLMSASTKENLAVFTSQVAKTQACPEQLEALRAQIPAKRLPPDRIEVTGVRIDGDRGFVLYRDEQGTGSAFPVIREDSAWKVAAIAGTNLP